MLLFVVLRSASGHIGHSLQRGLSERAVSSEWPALSKLLLSSLALTSFLISGRLVTSFFGRNDFCAALRGCLLRFSRREIYAFVAISLLLTASLTVLRWEADAQSDARQGFDRLYRPLVFVLLNFFLPDMFVIFALVVIVFGILAFGSRALGIPCTRTRGRYIGLGGISAALFCPAARFLNFSLGIITAIGIAFVARGSVAFEMMPTRVRRLPVRASA